MSRRPPLPGERRPDIATAIVTILGATGYMGLLVAAVHFPAATTPLRILAFVWFFGFGALYVARRC